MLGIIKRLLKKKRYKIEPFQGKGFIIKRYAIGEPVEIWSTEVESVLYGGPIDTEVAFIQNAFIRNLNYKSGRTFEWLIKGKAEIFSTKDCAKKMVDAFIEEDNKVNEERSAIQRFAKHNPAEWYP